MGCGGVKAFAPAAPTEVANYEFRILNYLSSGVRCWESGSQKFTSSQLRSLELPVAPCPFTGDAVITDWLPQTEEN